MTRARYAALPTAPLPTTLQMPLQGLSSRHSPETPHEPPSAPPTFWRRPTAPTRAAGKQPSLCHPLRQRDGMPPAPLRFAHGERVDQGAHCNTKTPNPHDPLALPTVLPLHESGARWKAPPPEV